MTDDRRTAPRAPGVLDGVWFGSGQRCRITSLSVTGCYIESLSPPHKGTRIQLQIELPQEGPVRLNAETAYIEAGMGFAISFIDVTPETREKLVRTVDLLIVTKGLTTHWDKPFVAAS